MAAMAVRAAAGIARAEGYEVSAFVPGLPT
jgi:hypothetical protein